MTTDFERKVCERFDLLWGFAPPDTLKAQKGKDIKDFLSKEIQKVREDILAALPKIPTRDTQIIIHTGGKDITKTTRKSLVAMGYAQAIEDCRHIITSKNT